MPYRLTPNADITGTSQQESVAVSANIAESVFGLPANRGDGYKTGREWIFTDPLSLHIITLYEMMRDPHLQIGSSSKWAAQIFKREFLSHLKSKGFTGTYRKATKKPTKKYRRS